jgi:hypothetical protein
MILSGGKGAEIATAPDETVKVKCLRPFAYSFVIDNKFDHRRVEKGEVVEINKLHLENLVKYKVAEVSKARVKKDADSIRRMDAGLFACGYGVGRGLYEKIPGRSYTQVDAEPTIWVDHAASWKMYRRGVYCLLGEFHDSGCIDRTIQFDPRH